MKTIWVRQNPIVKYRQEKEPNRTNPKKAERSEIYNRKNK